MWYIVLLTNVALVYSEWYSGEEKQKQTSTANNIWDAATPILTTSSIECILECQRRLRASYYVEKTNQCYCVLSENDKLSSKEIETLDGVFYKMDEPEVKDITFKRCC